MAQGPNVREYRPRFEPDRSVPGRRVGGRHRTRRLYRRSIPRPVGIGRFSRSFRRSDGGLSPDQRLTLARLILQALRFGVSVPDMLRGLAPAGPLGAVMVWMADAMMEGAALWEVLRDVGFEPDEVVSVRAAEATGQFDRLIPALVRRMELKRSVRQGVRSALSRQILTLVLASGTVWVLAERFLPTVAAVVHEVGGTVPAWCVGILRVGQWFVPVVVGMTVLAWWATGRAPSGLQGWADAWVRRIPGLRRVVLEMDWGQAFLTAAAGEQAGIGSGRAWAMAAQACRTAVVRRACQALAGYLQEAPMTEDFRRVLRDVRFPPMDALAVQTGLRTGDLAGVLYELGEAHMRQAVASAETLQDVLADAVLVAVGLLVAAIVLGGYVPLFQAYGRLG